MYGLTALVLVTVGFAMSGSQFVFVCGGDQDDLPQGGLALTSDGGFALAGYSRSFEVDHSMDIMVSRFDQFGSHMWTRIQGGPADEEALSVIPTADNGVVVIGAYGETVVSKFNASGGLVWSKVLDIPGGGGGPLMGIMTPDGGFALAGAAIVSGSGHGDMLIMRLGPSGEHLWTRILSIERSTLSEGATHIVQCPDNGFIIVGELAQGWGDPYPPFNPNIVISKFSSSGEHEWTRMASRNPEDAEYPYSVLPTSDGGVIVAGNIGSLDINTRDITIFKLDGAGNLAGETGWGPWGYDIPFSLAEMPDGGFITAGATGFSFFDPWNDHDILLARFDSDGNCLWGRILEGSKDEWANQVIVSPDNNIALVGTTSSFGSGDADIILSRFDLDGNHIQSWVVGTPATDGGDRMPYIASTSDRGFVVACVTKDDDCDILMVKFDNSGATCMGGPVEPLIITADRWSPNRINIISPNYTVTNVTPILWNATARAETPVYDRLCQILAIDETYGSSGTRLVAYGKSVWFFLPSSGQARLSVYNPTGRLVSRPVDGNVSSGKHLITLDLREGVYFVELMTNGVSIRTKTVIR